jgi:hypothetical protein
MIHYDIPEPDISPNFTIDDIHTIREWNYERLKDATLEERKEDTRTRIAPMLAEIEAARAAHKAKAV